MWYINDVVVVFPLLPVMQIILALVYRPANSISDMMGIPNAIIFLTIGASLGMPGLLITSSAFKISSSVCLPSSHLLCTHQRVGDVAGRGHQPSHDAQPLHHGYHRIGVGGLHPDTAHQLGGTLHIYRH